MKRTPKPIKGLKKKYHGINEHRLKDNPMEAQALLSFQKLAESAAGFNDSTDALDNLLHVPGVHAVATTGRRRDACTMIQWLGSPVGFAWLVDTFGLEVTRAMQRRSTGGSVKPGQVYASQDSHDRKVERKVIVVALRYGVNHALYRTGPNTHWGVRNVATRRLSYVYERRLLDPTQWKLVP